MLFSRRHTSSEALDAVRPFSLHLMLFVPAALMAVVLFWLMGSHNPVTPAGYVGYLTKGAVVGKTRFYGVQRGPVSPGRTWLLNVTNVSVTPYTYNEDFTGDEAVLSRDNLKIAFRVHTGWRISEDRIPLFLDRYSTTVSRDARADVHGTVQHYGVAPGARDGSRRHRQGRVLELRPRAAADVRAR